MSRTRTRGRRGRIVAAAVTGLLAVAALAAPAIADPGAPVKPTPGQSSGAAAPAERVCAERASASKSANDEFLSCLGVAAKLDRVPSVGETATLTVTVRAAAVLGPSTIRVELPAQLAWVQAPTGFATSQTTLAQPDRAGTIALAQATQQLAAGQAVTFTGVVRAVQAGTGQVQVHATAPDGPNVQAGEDDVFVTVAPSGSVSRLGFPAATGTLPVAKANPTKVASRPSWLVPQSVGTAGLATPAQRVSPNTPCDTRATGNWGYFDQNSAWHNSMNFQVQVWDQTNGNIAVGITDFSGNYNLCFDSALGHNIQIRFVSEVMQWRVQTGGNPMLWGTGFAAVTPGVTINFGSLTSGDPNLFRGMHAYDEANDAWLFIPKPVNGCFDQNDSTCRQLRINWAADSTDGTYYSPGGNDVHLAANDPNAAITVVHEISHAIMDDVYNDAMPSSPNCNPHSIQGTTSTGCAWVEGFAEWLPAQVYNDPFFRWPSGASLDLENESWGNGWGNGDSTEGRVAGSMIDITDSTNEATWDRYGEGFSNLWFTFTHHVSNTFAAFWASRAADGFNEADTGALADLYQNTIDYGFRDPLGDYAPLSRPTPTPHNFSYNTNTVYWSVVAVRPPAGADYDLTVYDDRNQTVFLGSSAYGSSTIDFVAVDSNRRALGDYYPRVNQFAGSGTYTVQLAQGASVLNTGSSTVSMGSANVVLVRDAFLTAGVPVTLSVAPTNVGQDPELFLMGDDPASSGTWVRGRPNALASSSGNGPGVTETITFTPTISAWYGVVVTNKQGSGNYTLTRS
jgi:hypothetical protein